MRSQKIMTIKRVFELTKLRTLLKRFKPTKKIINEWNTHYFLYYLNGFLELFFQGEIAKLQ